MNTDREDARPRKVIVRNNDYQERDGQERRSYNPNFRNEGGYEKRSYDRSGGNRDRKSVV